jgi:hypothetical protein
MYARCTCNMKPEINNFISHKLHGHENNYLVHSKCLDINKTTCHYYWMTDNWEGCQHKLEKAHIKGIEQRKENECDIA